MRPTCLLALPLCAACSSAQALTGATVQFQLDADFASEQAFFDFPYPSDLRLGPKGAPQGKAFPNPGGKSIIAGIKAVIDERPGFPVAPVGYFEFTADVAPQAEDAVIAAGTTSPILLIDVDPASPARGALTPVIAQTLAADDYVPAHVLAVAPRPGLLLAPKRQYAFVVMRALGDAGGAPLGQEPTLGALFAGQTPSQARGPDAAKLYAPLLAALAQLGLSPGDVAAATVFTTGDVVADLAALAQGLSARYAVSLADLQVEPDDGASLDGYCEIVGHVAYPQFQKGKPPFDTDGLFQFGSDGLPIKQRDEVATLTITLPKTQMPSGGFPLVVYEHGSGGDPRQIADRGKWVAQSDASKCLDKMLENYHGTMGCNTKGQGPGFVLAPLGIAMAASALPVSPDRLPGASETAYLNLGNLAATRDTFRQGVIEQHLFIAALAKLQIPPQLVSACSGLSLPPSETAFHFRDPQEAPLLLQGQSMGAMYANMIAATNPLVRAIAPSGSGGYWSYFITKTTLMGDTDKLISVLLGTAYPLSFMHPTLQALETAWEPVDPMMYMPRLAVRPLAGHPARSVYEPVGKGDSYFPTAVYDAMALAFGHREAGDEIWPSMQQALSLAGLGGVIAYPVVRDLSSQAGQYTGAVVQYEGDGVYDPHDIFSQLDQVKYQYSCFFDTMLKTGEAKILAPAPLGTPCE